VPITPEIFAIKTQSKTFLILHEQVSLMVYIFIDFSFVLVHNKEIEACINFYEACIFLHSYNQYILMPNYSTDLMQRHTQIRVQGIRVPSTILLT